MKFRVSLEGENFLVALEASTASKHGFYVTAHVEADTEDEAEASALELLRTHDRLRGLVRNSDHDSPRLRAEKIARIDAWPVDVTRPLTGLAWYKEEREPNQSPQTTRGKAPRV